MIVFPEISPEVFSFAVAGFSFSVRWYALAYIAGFLIGWKIGVAAIRRPHVWLYNSPPLSASDFEKLVSWLILGVIIGGRLGYVLFYKPAYFLSNPLEIVMVWKGGMAFHGGFLGVVVAAYLFFRRNNIPIGSGADLLALCTPVGLLLGRLANFINGELWGRPTDLPWGVVFPSQAAQACGKITDICARHPSQLYEAILEGIILGGLLLYFAFIKGYLKKRWFITGAFLTGYGISRSFVEIFRQPDPQFQTASNPIGYVVHWESFGLTMGQILSIPMMLIGIFLIYLAFKNAKYG